MVDRALGVSRRRRLAMTPLVDVIFLLLLFFMLTSTFLKENVLPFGLGGQANHSVSTSDMQQVLLQLKDNQIYMDTERIDLMDLSGELQARGDGVVLLAMTANSPSQLFAEVLQQVKSLQNWQVVVIGVGP